MQENAFTEMDQFISVPLESIPRDTVLPYRLYLFISGKFTMFRNFGDTLSSNRADQLALRSVDVILVPSEDLERFINSLEKELDHIGVRERDEKSALKIRNLLFSYWKSIESRDTLESNLYEKFKKASQKMPIAIGNDRTLAHKLLRRYDDPAMYFANHTINTAIYSIAIGLKRRLSEPELQELTLVACVCNLGNIKIPKDILHKRASLNDEEWAVIRRHPEYGQELLGLLFEKKSVCVAVRHHHERFDGEGYPSKLKGGDIPLFSRIVSIGEVFSALTGTRPWAPAIKPSVAVEQMQEMSGKFDPQLFASSIKE